MKSKILFSLVLIILITLFSMPKVYASPFWDRISEELSLYIPEVPMELNFKKHEGPKKIVGSSRIQWSKGWKKMASGNLWSKDITYQATLGGSEFNFKLIDTKKIRFYLETSNKDSLVGLEVWLDGKNFDFSYPNIKPEQTIVEVEDSQKNKIHQIRGRVYCFIIPATSCDLRIKSIEIDESARLLSSGRNKKKTLSILGDSISGVWGNKNYTYKLSDMIGYYLINASFNGSTMSEDEATFSGLLRIKDEIIAYKPDLLVIFLGTNDLGHKITLESFSRDYEKTANILKKELPKTNVVLLGLLPRVDYTQEEIASFSAVIKNIASKYKFYYTDTYNWLHEKDFYDGIHPSIDAQTKLAELVYNYLKDSNLLSQNLR